MRRLIMTMLLVISIGIGSCGKKEATKIDQSLTDTPVEDILIEQNRETVQPSRDLDRNIVDMMTADEQGAEDVVFEVIYFGLDESSLTPQARDLLSKHAEMLKAHPKVSLMIEGHCDERGTIEYNLALGERRAVAVKNYLINYGINQSRLYTISYGKERPVDSGHSEAALSQNRRAAFQIIGQ